jgi:hypothetical protein
MIWIDAYHRNRLGHLELVSAHWRRLPRH